MLNCNICAHYNNNYAFPLRYMDNKYFSDKIEYLNMWRTSFVLNATFILFILFILFQVIDGDFSMHTCVLHRNISFFKGSKY